MKKFNAAVIFATVALIFGAASIATMEAYGQETVVDKINVPLSDPTRPVKLECGILNGSITVKGVSGIKEVVVEASIRYQEYKRERKSDQTGGLRRIQNTSSGLSVEEEDNNVDVSTGMAGHSRTIDLKIQVPTNTSMELSTTNDGDILVENVVGDLEINNTNGKITLVNISGSAVAHALNENIVATFTKVNAQKSMSFSSLNGKIDVTFPSDIKATVFMKSDQGEIYTDFDMPVEQSALKAEEEKGSRGKYRVSFERGMKGTINGGGMEMQFSNFNGDIYIRKGK